MGAPIINPDEFASYVLVFLRLSMLMVLAPIFSGSFIPAQAKAALSVALTVAVAPLVKYQGHMMPMSWLSFGFLALGELIIGLVLAMMVRMVLEAANVAGEYVSFQMSLSMLNSMDPQSGRQVPMMALFFNIAVTIIFLYANGHMMLLKAFADSFKVAPPGFLNIWQPQLFTEILKALAAMYVLALKLAAPVIGVLFCVKVAFGVVAKAIPQVNILFVGVPVYILVGFVVIGYALPWWPRFLEWGLLNADHALNRILKIVAPAAGF